MVKVRGYRLRKGDIFSIDLNSFMTTSILWNSQFQIMKFDKYKRKWWKIWKPKYTYFVRLMYLGEGEEM